MFEKQREGLFPVPNLPRNGVARTEGGVLMVKQFLTLDTGAGHPRLEVVLTSRNRAGIGFRVFNSIRHPSLRCGPPPLFTCEGSGKKPVSAGVERKGFPYYIFFGILRL
ncbi:MAG: 5'-nucleotidase [Acidiferrobacter sp.]